MAAMKSIFLNPIWFLVFLFLCVREPGSYIAGATNTIEAGDELNFTGTLVSDNGIFTLGFYTIDATGYSYLGIWYHDEIDRRVWTANRNSPIVDGSGVLRNGRDGMLAIYVGGNRLMNVSDQRGSGNLTARLENSGNFVLFDEIENRTIWQSFDHPVATLLTGAKLGFNRTTRQNWTLQSWLSDSLAFSGAFTLSVESGQLLIRRKGQPYWNSGPWNNQTQNFRFTTALTDPTNRITYNLSYASETDGEFFAFRSATEITAVQLALQISPMGHIIDCGNAYRDIIPPDVFCYGYEADGGCVSSDLPDCRRYGDRFEERNGDFVNADVINVNNSNIGTVDCMERCWNDCGCVGFTTGGNGTGCVLWRGRNEFRVGASVSKYVLLSQRPSRVVALLMKICCSVWRCW